MQLLPREGGERVRESQLLFQIKVREEPLLCFIFYFIFTFFLAYLIACARVASVLPDQGVRGDVFFFFAWKLFFTYCVCRESLLIFQLIS